MDARAMQDALHRSPDEDRMGRHIFHDHPAPRAHGRPTRRAAIVDFPEEIEELGAEPLLSHDLESSVPTIHQLDVAEIRPRYLRDDLQSRPDEGEAIRVANEPLVDLTEV
jgi:hypothetical protein